MTDPVADMLTRIRNASAVSKKTVLIPHANLKVAIAKVLKEEGYINDYEVVEDSPVNQIKVTLKYVGKEAAISRIDRVSRPGRRVYVKSKYIEPTLSGYGLAIVSTSKGVMTDKAAIEAQLGGEVLCKIW